MMFSLYNDELTLQIFPQGNEIFGHLQEEQYERVIKALEHAILATDLALYFRYDLLLYII